MRMKTAAKRLTAGMLCAAVTLSCFSGLNQTAFAAENGFEPIEASNGLDSPTKETVPEIDGEESVNTKTIPPATDFVGLEEQGSWYYGSGWEYQYSGAENSAVTQENGLVKATVDYSADADKEYSKMAISNWNDDAVSFENVTQVTFDLYYDEANMTAGTFKIAVNSDVLNVDDTGLDLSKASVVEGTLKKLPVVLHCDKANGAINGITFCLIGVNTDYKGDVWLDNVQFIKEDSGAVKPDGLPALWTFDNNIDGWSYGGAWEYDGPADISWDSDKEMLRLDVDYSGNAASGWSEFKIDYRDSNGLDLTGADCLSMDVIFDPSQMSGGLSVKISSDGVLDDSKGVNLENAEPYGDGLQKVSYMTSFNTIKNGDINKFTIGIVGNNTNYKGSIWLDNIKFDVKVEPDEYIDATESARTETVISGNSSALTVNGKDYSYASEIQLADPDADASVVALYQYLKAVGESDSALYGHMEDTVLKAGDSELSYSDTEDMTGSLAAINGLDCGGLFSGFADKYNSRHPEDKVPNTIEGDIKAAALLSNEAIAEGTIMTLSLHMPNFAFAEEKDLSAVKPYDRYDYSKADSYNLQGNCMNQILPGGAFNPQFTAYLDLVAEYAEQVDGAILFRPFHENTGSWFWWGKAFCDAETYKSVFRYTVEYLRDEKGIHNLLYVYGPGSEAATLEEYGERYPGDAFVDMVGFDTYDNDASNSPSYTFMKNLEMTVELTDRFAKEHGKLFAITETGIANSAMKKQGNERPEWFTEILDIVTDPAYNCSYYMVWSNYDSKGNYYTPFVVSKSTDGTLHGHELLDGFIRFYNNEKSIFASDQKNIPHATAPAVAGWINTGYFTAPIAGTRILEPTAISAQVSTGTGDAAIVVSNGTTEITLNSTVSGRTVTAALTTDVLAQLGESANGKILLRSGAETLAEITVIYNIPEKEPDLYMVDDFESYYGVDSMLTAAWATNKATGSNITVSLDNKKAQDGCSMKFDYSESSGGWAGATITRTVDWSDCNALQFWTVPDGKQQKTVIQIDANNTCYEVYLNLYDTYNARAGQPTLVTIPFSEFCQRDTAGNPKGGLVQDSGSVGSFGLWVNAIDNEFLVDGAVSGTIWYDNITAVTSDYTEPAFEEPGSTPPAPQTYTITASAGTGGSISPSGSISVDAGKSQSFTISAKSGYRIADVKVDGKSVGAVSTYTIADIAENHTIEASFTVYSRPSSGGGSGSSSSKPSKPSEPSIPSEPSKPSAPSEPSEPTTPSTPSQPTVTYMDVPSGSWYFDAVQYVSEHGFMTGTAANTFSPNTVTNRAMLWTVLARMDGADTSSGGTIWYEKSMSWVMNKGISDGTGALENMTREQMVTMLWRYKNSPSPSGSLSRFADGGTVSSWAADAVCWAVTNGLLTGFNGSLNPKAAVTRAETATILMRFCQNMTA